MARNGSPGAMSPTQQLSKRDKRRKNIMEKLDAMITTFSRDQTQHYRAQLQAIQVEMTMILRADPYENMPLDDDPQKIEDQVESLIAGKAAKEDFYALAGRRYYEYCQEINRAQEQRDTDLAMLKNYYDNANAELERSHAFKIQVAQREHTELANTIRQRLINTVTRKRDRLLREKEHLDIADSNALLLHPSHYTMNAPASPGGIHSNRKTRHTRNRAGDVEDGLYERGRKRKLGDDEGIESPIPGYRPITQDGNGGFSPFQDQRAKLLRAQQEAPAYSVESIFTEKELALATSTAQIATHHFFYQQQAEQTQAAAKTNATDGTSANGASASEMADRPASPPKPPALIEATGMERQVSNYATRGATRANPLSFLSDAAMAMSTADPVLNPFLPSMIAITKMDKGAPTPPGASSKDVQNDLAMMSSQSNDAVPTHFFAKPAEDGSAAVEEFTVAEAREIFLEQACRESLSTQPFRVPLTDAGPAMIKEGVNRPATIGFADPASIPAQIRDGTANAALAAAAGYSALVGVPLSRTGSDMGASDVGGTGMRRTRSTRNF